MDISVVPLSKVPAAFLLWRQRHGWVLTVAARATFGLRPGEAVLAAEQEPIEVRERPFPQGSQGLYAPCDLVPMKARADVVLVGQAYAPEGRPTRSLVARLAVAGIEKRIEVHSDRWVGPGGVVREGSPFAAMPLVYERTAGGPGSQNPVGVRSDVRDAYGFAAAPNLNAPGADVASQKTPPVGFGPIAATWPTRRSRLADGAMPQDWNGQTLRPDFDPGFFQAAPPDQQLAALSDDEVLTLENLNREHRELVTRLPSLRPTVFAVARSASPVEVAMRADTLWIDSTRAICTVTWRGRMPLEHAADALRIYVMAAPSARTPTWSDFERAIGRGERGLLAGTSVAQAPAIAFASDGSETLPVSSKRREGPAMPFAEAPAAISPREPASDAALPFRADGGPAALLERAPDPELAVGAETLPVRPRARAAPAEPPTVEPAPISSPASGARSQPGAEPFRFVGMDPDALDEARRDERFHDVFRRPSADAERDATELLLRGRTIGADALSGMLATAFRSGAGLVHPLALVAGELTFPADELDTLRAVLASAAPRARQDAEATLIVALAKRLLAAGGGAAAGAVEVTKRLTETFERRGLSPEGILEDQAARALVRARARKRAIVFGGAHVRASFTGSPPAEGTGIPAYLGENLAAKLTASTGVRVRMLVEVRPAIDASDGNPLALRVVGLGTVALPFLPR